MADKTMPERIWVVDGMVLTGEDLLRDDFSSMRSATPAPHYVRADIAAGDASEPLADGQHRWVRVGGEWNVVFVWKRFLSDGFGFGLGNIDYWEEDIEKIGPVVRPPADAAN